MFKGILHSVATVAVVVSMMSELLSALGQDDKARQGGAKRS